MPQLVSDVLGQGRVRPQALFPQVLLKKVLNLIRINTFVERSADACTRDTGHKQVGQNCLQAHEDNKPPHVSATKQEHGTP